MRPDRAALMAADAGESSKLREIAAVITRLPVELESDPNGST